MGLQDQLNVIKKGVNMQKLNLKETFEIVGGISISAALFSALSKAATTVIDAGRALGSAIRRFYTGNLCPLK